MPSAPAGLTLFTAGYQGHNIETFLDLLMSHGVEHVIDVRQLPFSRKPDFSKKRLAAHLAGAGIGYTHIVALGTPKPLRDELRREHDLPAFFTAMRAIVEAQPYALREALEIARARPSALLCFDVKLRPGQRGTKQWLAKYGDQLVCVRYRYDTQQHKRYTAVELIVAEGPWTPPPPAPDSIVGVRVAWGEAALARQLKAVGGQWNRQQQVWNARYDQVVALGLLDRLVAPELYCVQEWCFYDWMPTSSSRNLHPIVVT